MVPIAAALSQQQRAEVVAVAVVVVAVVVVVAAAAAAVVVVVVVVVVAVVVVVVLAAAAAAVVEVPCMDFVNVLSGCTSHAFCGAGAYCTDFKLYTRADYFRVEACFDCATSYCCQDNNAYDGVCPCDCEYLGYEPICPLIRPSSCALGRHLQLTCAYRLVAGL
jgi:hypothetical protein